MKATSRNLAEDLGWWIDSDIGKIIPISDLAHTLYSATLNELACGQELEADFELDPEAKQDSSHYGITPPVARLLDWLIRHKPVSAARTIGEIIGDAERRLKISRQVSERSLRTALVLDGKLDKDARETFLTRVFSPSDCSGE